MVKELSKIADRILNASDEREIEAVLDSFTYQSTVDEVAQIKNFLHDRLYWEKEANLRRNYVKALELLD